MFDNVIQSAPSCHIAKDSDGQPIGEAIGAPFCLFIDLLASTSAAYDLFRLRKFNAALKDLLDAWGNYLQDPKQDSNTVLNPGEEGWFSPPVIANLERELRGRTFNKTFCIPDPNAENRGYVSWGNFFNQTITAWRAPFDFPENKTFIHSACESTVYLPTTNSGSRPRNTPCTTCSTRQRKRPSTSKAEQFTRHTSAPWTTIASTPPLMALLRRSP